MNDYSESNFLSTTSPSPESHGKVKGRVKSKHKRVAALLSMGLPVPLVAKETGLSESRIYHLLSDKNSFVNSEMNRVTEETLKTRNALLLNLYLEVLHHLDAMLESGDDKERDLAIDTILDLVLSRRGRNGQSFISQHFNFQSQGNQGNPETVDEWIIQKSKERELKVDKTD